jgi:MFS family permease
MFGFLRLYTCKIFSGYYVGLIASMQFAGLMFGSYIWGYLSDKFGRRRTLLSSITGVTVFCALFGFTNTTLGLPWAIFCRFMTGAFNGSVAIIRSIINDVSANNNDQAKGMTWINCAFQFGMVLGPTIGGTLAQPVRQYPSSFSKGGFFDDFPFFLPCAVVTGLNVLILAIVAIKLPETRTKRLADMVVPRNKQSLSSTISHPLNGVKLLRVVYNKKEEEVLMEAEKDYTCERQIHDHDYSSSDLDFLESNNRDSGQSAAAMNSSSGRMLGSVRGFVKKLKVTTANSTAAELLKLSGVRWVLLLYCIYCFGVIGFSEMSNVWFATKPHKGGLGFSELQIGILTAAAAIALVPLTLFTVPRIESKVGTLKAFQIGSIILIFTSMMFPVLASITNAICLWTLLVASQLVFRVFIATCFIMIGIFINNSVGESKVGAINGISVALSGIARSV